MLIQLSQRSRQRFLFLFGIAAVYAVLFVWSDYLQGPTWWDENTFWKTSLTFSDRLIPSLDQLRDYEELNTPLPFIIYGALEYLFRGGLFVGRLLNFVLSVVMSLAIGYPHKDKSGKSVLCLVGLLLCPYYLWLSSRLYTDIIASFFVLAGFWFYHRDRHFLSGAGFALGIASRQYMLAFPVAVAVFEFIQTFVNRRQGIHFKQMLKWIFPSLATLTILGWFYLFQGIAPSSGIENRPNPEVQETVWALLPGGGLFFLAVVGLYFVIPEMILFRYRSSLLTLMTHRKSYLKYALIALSLLLLFVLFPPALFASGNLIKAAELLSPNFLKFGLFYCLALLTCVRFSRLDLPFWILAFNCLIMMKAHPWDRYVLPLVVVFWYLKSINYMEIPEQALLFTTSCLIKTR